MGTDQGRAGDARSALAAAFAGLVHNQDDGTDSADRALEVLRSLPVEERMEAMGMEQATGSLGGPWWVDDAHGLVRGGPAEPWLRPLYVEAGWLQ